MVCGRPTQVLQSRPWAVSNAGPKVVAGILEYARVEGFLANSEKLFEQSDIERTDWETFLEAIEDGFQGGGLHHRRTLGAAQ